jgi:cholesterol oxidase
MLDAIIIGSGFGGAVTAARLAEANYRIAVLERGRRWDKDSFPRKLGDPWLFDVTRPVERHGWFDFRVFPHMSVVQGAGVGGGSLVYANISVNAKSETFDAGWPAEITCDELAPHYARVGTTMNVAPVPLNQWPERTRMMKEAATKSGWGDRFRRLDLAVTFDDTWSYDLPDPHSPAHSKPIVNAQGRQQGTCVHLGDCDVGCKVNARNTLDLNYLAIAEERAADVRPLHIVKTVEPIANGYRVHFDRIANGQLVPDHLDGRLVILAAGSLGSTEILLRARNAAGTLPNISDRVGRNWSSNGDFLTPAFHLLRKVLPTRGPTITSAIDLLDGTVDGEDIFIEDGGLPDLTRGFLEELAEKPGIPAHEHIRVAWLRMLARLHALPHIMPWFAQSRDAADGVLSLKDGKLFLDWNIAASEGAIDAVVKTHEKFARATQGLPLVPAPWTFAKDLVTPHPLGGARMASGPGEGVVDHKGEVFGHPNLFVADGAIVPKALGLNPSKTIAALAERIASIIVAEGR